MKLVFLLSALLLLSVPFEVNATGCTVSVTNYATTAITGWSLQWSGNPSANITIGEAVTTGQTSASIPIPTPCNGMAFFGNFPNAQNIACNYGEGGLILPITATQVQFIISEIEVTNGEPAYIMYCTYNHN